MHTGRIQVILFVREFCYAKMSNSSSDRKMTVILMTWLILSIAWWCGSRKWEDKITPKLNDGENKNVDIGCANVE